MSTLQSKGYEIFNELGEGACAKVFIANDSNGNKVAIKEIDKEKFEEGGYQIKYVEAEIKSMKQIKSPHIVEIIDHFEDNHSIYIVMEYCDQNLAQYINQYARTNKKSGLEEIEAREIIYQILKGMVAINKAGYSHRDIKPENILLKNKVFKIADFGFAKQSTNQMSTIAGTEQYMCPEMLNEQMYNFKCDVWSIGVVYFNILYGIKPFNSLRDVIKIIDKICKDKPFDLNNLSWTEESRKAKRDNTSEASRVFFREVFQYYEDKRIDFVGIFQLPFISELQSYQKEKSIIDKELMGYNDGSYENKMNMKDQKLNQSKIKQNNNFSQIGQTKKAYEPVQNHDDGLDFDFSNIQANNLKSFIKKPSSVEFSMKIAREILDSHHQLGKEEEIHYRNVEKIHLIRLKYLFLKLVQQDCMHQANSTVLKEYASILPYLLTKCRIILIQEQLAYLKNNQNAWGLDKFTQFTQSKSYGKVLEVIKEDYKIAEGDIQTLFQNIDMGSIPSTITDKNILSQYVYETNFEQIKMPYRNICFEVIKILVPIIKTNPSFSQLAFKIVICSLINRLFEIQPDFNYMDAFVQFRNEQPDVRHENFVERLCLWITVAESASLKKQINQLMENYFQKQ